MANVNVTINMDEDMKQQADELFSDMGLTLSTAVTIFVKRSIKERRIPFEVSADIPNESTKAAIAEIEQLKKDPNKKVYSSFDQILEKAAND